MVVANSPAASVCVRWAMWSLIGLGRLQEKQHHELYGLLAYSDSAGHVFWSAGGEHAAHLYLDIPFWCGIGAMLISLIVGSWGLQRAGWITVFAYWLFGAFCTAGLAAVMAWFWVNAAGVFI
jgi:hypothetical protein